MPLTDVAEDLLWVRARIGDDPDDDRLDEIFDSDGIGTRGLTALWVLENRLANLLANPTGFSIPDVYSETTTSAELVKMLQGQIGALKMEIGPLGDEYALDGDFAVGVLDRADYGGRR